MTKTLSLFVLLALQANNLVSAQGSGYTPLASRVIPYDQIPYRIDNVASGRGPQAGYNICNSTTEGPESMCQTAFVNSLEDFCLWGLPEPGQTVGDAEGEAVAYCTAPGHGTRVIPPGAIYGAQFIQTETYIQITGRMDQTQLDMAAGDYGGEMDPIGADQRGNPLGGLMYSTAFQGNNTNSSLPTQIRYWTNFMGSSTFCIKICDPNDPIGPRQCEHIYDRIGCAYNMPAAYRNQTFESCEGDLGLLPGVYRGANGQLTTYTQPPESLGVITTIPYTASIPPTSNCVSPSAPPAAFLIPGRSVSASGSGAASVATSAASAPPGSITGSAGSSAVLLAASSRSVASATSGASTITVSALATLSLTALAALLI